MRFSVWLNSGRTWPEIRDAAIRAEDTGWDGIWLPDHFMPPEEGYDSQPEHRDDPELGPVHEAWSLLAAIAAVTSSARIGVLVSGNTYRHPAVVAKMVATIDHVSAGRAVLGLGASWQENEHRRYGMAFGTARDRSDRLEEAAAMITGLLTRPRTDHDGHHYRLVGAPLQPKPIQDPLPLLIGGGGERRTLRTTARYAQEWNIWGRPDDLAAKGEILDRHLAVAGRRPDSVARTAAAFLAFADDEASGRELTAAYGRQGGLVGTPNMIRAAIDAYGEAGCSELIVPDYNFQPDARNEAFDRFQREVLGR
jgi:alkanesulfonate monooxygenase SsuD/methylene tetrahydromethanopterin reductase-like flavin-dependent oxidoreductase (luciferase family)